MRKSAKEVKMDKVTVPSVDVEKEIEFDVMRTMVLSGNIEKLTNELSKKGSGTRILERVVSSEKVETTIMEVNMVGSVVDSEKVEREKERHKKKEKKKRKKKKT